MHIYHHLWNSRSFLLAPSYNTSYCQAPHPTPPPLFHQHMANIIWVTETGRKYFMISPYCIYTCWSLIFSWEKKILALLRVEPLPTAWTGGVVLVPVRCTSPTAPWWEHRFCRDMIWLGTDDIITIVARHYRLEIDTMRAPTHAASWSIHATACHVYMHGTPTPWPWDRDCASNFIWIVSPDLVDRLILGHYGVDYWVVKTCMIGVVHACQPKGQQTHHAQQCDWELAI